MDMQKWMAEQARRGFSGAVQWTREGQAVYAGAFGEAHRGLHVPNTMDTRFDLASVMKLFTACGALLLAQEGRLSLNSRIHELADLQNSRIPKDVTVHQLLSHTSGIADDADEEAGEDYAALFRDHPNYAVRQCRDMLPNFLHKPPLFPAGTAVRYNNCAFVLVGLAMENVTGEPFREWMVRRLFAPLGLADTLFYEMDRPCLRLAEGYFIEDGLWRKNIYSFPPVGTPDGGGCSTVGDLTRFLRLLWQGKVLDTAHTALMTTPRVAFSRPARGGVCRYGYGLQFIMREGKIAYAFKEGCNNGVDNLVAYKPQTQEAFAVLSNNGLALAWRALEPFLDQDG